MARPFFFADSLCLELGFAYEINLEPSKLNSVSQIKPVFLIKGVLKLQLRIKNHFGTNFSFNHMRM